MCTLGYLPAVAWGGPVRVVDENARELQRRGHQVSICASNRQNKSTYLFPSTRTENVRGLRVSYLHTYMVKNWRGTAGPTLLSIRAMRVLWNEIKTADVVHANGTRNAIVMTAYVFSRLQKKPFILQPHGTLPAIISSVRLKKIFDGLFMRIILRNSSALLALQEAEREQILNAGGDPERIWIVPNGISTDNCPNEHELPGRFRDKYQIPEDQFMILFVGRINPKKGVDLLVEAFAQFPDELKSKTRLVIAGPDDGQLSDVQLLVERHGLGERVIFTDVLSADEVRNALVDADLFVLPARRDTFPMAIVEACTFGVPMVVTDTCEIASQLSGKAASVVAVDSGEISKAMQKLISDAELRENYRLGGYELTKTVFSIRGVGDMLEKIYTRVLGGTMAHQDA